MSQLFFNKTSILFLSLSLISLIFLGCEVGTNSSVNIPGESKILEESSSYKILKDDLNWGNDIEPKPIFSSGEREGFKAYKVIVESEGRYSSGMVAKWLYRDNIKMVDVFAITLNRYIVDLSSAEKTFTDVEFQEFNRSQRAVIVGADVESKNGDLNTLKIWINKDESVDIKDGYIDDIIVDDEVYSIYKIQNSINIIKKESVQSFIVNWETLIKVLVGKKILADETIFKIKNIFFGFEIMGGSELFVIKKFVTTSSIE